jgi:hypothetical protein
MAIFMDIIIINMNFMDTTLTQNTKLAVVLILDEYAQNMINDHIVRHQ